MSDKPSSRRGAAARANSPGKGAPGDGTQASAPGAGAPHRIVIVGGGAGGLELATRLGDTLGRRGKAEITLIEKTRTHVWKPKLHQIASGSMDMSAHEVGYLAQSHWHHFRYRVGEMVGLDRARREVLVAPHLDEEGRQVTPQRSFGYDTLVIAVGSQSNDFGTAGVREHALKLESPADALRLHSRMVNACIRAHAQATPLRPEQLQVAVIGAGATGVELAAELHRTTREVVAFGLDRVDAEKDIRITLVEAAPRVLPALPPRLSQATEQLLRKIGVEVHTGAKVAAVQADGVRLADGRLLPAELVVWAAGVKAPDFLRDIAGCRIEFVNPVPDSKGDLMEMLSPQQEGFVGEMSAAGVKAPDFLRDIADLESNRINQLVVHATLQTSRDENIFAIGDCAACAWPQANQGKGGQVPPRAQAAHQQASHMVGQIRRRIAGLPLADYRYRDFDSLVSLGQFRTLGNMLGGLMVGGLFARLMYLSLYKMHELALHGFPKVALDTLARLIARRTEPSVKLH